MELEIDLKQLQHEILDAERLIHHNRVILQMHMQSKETDKEKAELNRQLQEMSAELAKLKGVGNGD